jgi:hypothetical protein
MKFLTSLFITGVVAISLDNRSPAIISRSAAFDLRRDVAALKAAIVEFRNAIGDTTGVVHPLYPASMAVNAALKHGTSDARDIDVLASEDAEGVAQSIQDLGAPFDRTMSALLANKDTLISKGQGGMIHRILLQQQTSMKEFTAAVSEKVTSSVQPKVQKFANLASRKIDHGVAAFEIAASVAAADTHLYLRGNNDQHTVSAMPSDVGGVRPSMIPNTVRPSIMSSTIRPSILPSTVSSATSATTPPATTSAPVTTTITAPTSSSPTTVAGAAMPTAAAGLGAVAAMAVAVIML